ncbi:helix-turn-helix domain-containing protein [Sphingobacterium prati]|uniref:helix-turn-helix domain-containing protein n=1 Tax=Sphingobacterium prati TaxID=2737006 RepID=UPI001556C0EC|nr:AraC family transcriptional regulator [Sphingobacterium prati]NPE48916.1 helix-turn-helix transcriptional regulator [Sphingobacterium prati]
MELEQLAAIDDDQDDFYVCHTYVDRIDPREYIHRKARLLYADGGIIHVFTATQHWYLPGRFYMWIPANTTYHLESSSSRIHLYSFYFKEQKVAHSVLLNPNIFLSNDLMREMFLFAQDWEGRINKKNSYSKYCLLRAMMAIIPEMSPPIDAFPMQHPYPKSEKLQRIARYLNTNIDQAFTIEQVATQFGMSSRSLSRLFKEDMGISYIRFLRAIRIAKALELMAENTYSILEIAMRVGYNELSSFSNIFTRVTGIRPSVYMSKINEYKN